MRLVPLPGGVLTAPDQVDPLLPGPVTAADRGRASPAPPARRPRPSRCDVV